MVILFCTMFFIQLSKTLQGISSLHTDCLLFSRKPKRLMGFLGLNQIQAENRTHLVFLFEPSRFWFSFSKPHLYEKSYSVSVCFLFAYKQSFYMLLRLMCFGSIFHVLTFSAQAFCQHPMLVYAAINAVLSELLAVGLS